MRLRELRLVGGGALSVIASLAVTFLTIFDGFSKLYDKFGGNLTFKESIEKIFSFSDASLLGFIIYLFMTASIIPIVINGIATLIRQIVAYRRDVSNIVSEKITIRISLSNENEHVDIDLTKPKSLTKRLRDIERKLLR